MTNEAKKTPNQKLFDVEEKLKDARDYIEQVGAPIENIDLLLCVANNLQTHNNSRQRILQQQNMNSFFEPKNK